MSTGGSIRAVAVFRRSALLALAALTGVAGCTSVDFTEESFEGTNWRVAAINEEATPATHLYRVQFNDGRIGGRFGCNQFGGAYRVERERLIVENVTSTLIGCPEPAATHEAQAFLVLSQPMNLEMSGQRLILGNAAGSITLEPSG